MISSGVKEIKVVKEGLLYNLPRYFLLCNSCYWCASFFRRSAFYTECPLCTIGNIDYMPIGALESYNFNYDSKMGVELKFYSCQLSEYEKLCLNHVS